MRKAVCITTGILLVISCLTAIFWHTSRQYDKLENVVASKVLGLVVTVTEDQWQDSLITSVTDCARQSNFEIMVIQAERSQSSQIEAIRALIAYQADVILFFPIVDSGWDYVLHEAQESQIPILAVDKAIRSSPGGFNVNYAGYDYYGDAAKAARILAAYAGNKDIIIECYGTLGSYSSKEITRGFREVLEEHDLQIQSSISGDFMRSRGREIAEVFLNSDTGIDFMISHNEAMTLGALEAIEQAGKEAGKDVHIFAVGGGEETVKLADQGKITCLVKRDAQELGEKAIEAVNLLLSSKEAKEVSVLVQTELIVKGDTVP